VLSVDITAGIISCKDEICLLTFLTFIKLLKYVCLTDTVLVNFNRRLINVLTSKLLTNMISCHAESEVDSMSIALISEVCNYVVLLRNPPSDFDFN